GVERRVRAIGGSRHVGHVAYKLRVRELRTLRLKIGVHPSVRADTVALPVAAVPATAGVIARPELFFQTRLLEWVEVVPAAHPENRLATVVELLQVLHQLARRRKRDMRAIPQLHRTVGAFLAFDDLSWLQTIAADPVDRIVEQRAVIGEIDRY